MGVFLMVAAMAYALLGFSFHYSISGPIFLLALIVGALLILWAVIAKFFSERRNDKKFRRKM